MTPEGGEPSGTALAEQLRQLEYASITDFDRQHGDMDYAQLSDQLRALGYLIPPVVIEHSMIDQA